MFYLVWTVYDYPLCAQTLHEAFTKQDRLLYKGYGVRRFHDSKENVWFATVAKEGKTLATFKSGGPLKEMTRFGLFPFLGGKVKQLIIEQYSGGAHCCWSYWIFSLVPDFQTLYNSQNYPVGYELAPKDLDKDGVFEFTQTILTFDYFDRLPHALSPLPAVIFKYQEKKNEYLPPNNAFTEYLLRGIEEDIEKVEELREKTDLATYDDTRGDYLSLVLEVVLRYIYAGKEKEGWSFYHKEYNLADKEEMKSKIRKKLESCLIYKEIYAR